METNKESKSSSGDAERDTAENGGDPAFSSDGQVKSEQPMAGESKEVAHYRTLADQARQELLYLRAEFENTKRRILREQEQSIRYGNERLVSDLVPAIDLLERAIASAGALRAKNDAEVNSFLTGVEMTHREFVQILGRFGVEFIGVVGEKFDPARHEAISQAEVAEPEKADTVLQVLQRGCRLESRLLSPAKVIVARLKSAQ
jgi:molecular chaperone GrpE